MKLTFTLVSAGASPTLYLYNDDSVVGNPAGYAAVETSPNQYDADVGSDLDDFNGFILRAVTANPTAVGFVAVVVGQDVRISNTYAEAAGCLAQQAPTSECTIVPATSTISITDTGPYGLKLAVATSHWIHSRYDGVRIRIDATDACNMSSKIFAYRMLPLNPSTGSQQGHYSHICSTSDLAEYPEDSPTPGQSPSWFRLSYVDVLVRSWEEANELINIVQEDVIQLCRSLNNMRSAAALTTIAIGRQCDESSSSSSSSSSDSSSSAAYTSHQLTTSPTFYQSRGVGAPWTGLQIDIPAGAVSQHLYLQGFDFAAIPADAVVYGIEITVALRRVFDGSSSSSSSSSSSDNATDGWPELLYVSAHHPTSGLGQDPLLTKNITSDDFEAFGYGDPDNLWGLTWTVPDIIDGAFGVGLVVRADTLSVGATVEASLELSSVTVHYGVPV